MANAECNGYDGDDWDIYKDSADKWRWRRKAGNGEIVGASSEGYANRADCEANAKRHGFGG
jgi:uncharacterized protein YegP (UPF0339 family)